MTNIPKAPKPLVINGTAKKRLEEWILYFQNLSPRIKMILKTDPNFNLDIYKEFLLEKLDPEENAEITGWPSEKNVLFVIMINSSLEENNEEYKTNNIFIFCLNNLAFGLDYFESEEDLEIGHFSNDYSLQNFPEDALSWSYISKIIERLILEIEEESIPIWF